MTRSSPPLLLSRVRTATHRCSQPCAVQNTPPPLRRRPPPRGAPQHHLQVVFKLGSNAGASKEELENLKKETINLKEKEEKASKEINQLKEKLSSVSESLKKMKLESEEKDKRIETAEAHVTSLQKQAADLLLEYDRLLEDNQNLQAQTQRH